MSMDTAALVGGGLLCLLGSLLGAGSLRDRKQAQQLERCRVVESLSDMQLLLDSLPLLVAVSGTAWAEKPLTTEVTGQKAAIVKLKEDFEFERLVPAKLPPAAGAVGGMQQQQQQRQGQELEWVIRKEPRRNLVQETTWGLRDLADSGVWLPVVGGSSAEGDYMQPAGQAWQAAGEDIDSIRMSWTRGYRPLGTRTQEWALPVGDTVSAVGELALASEGRTLDDDGRHSAMGSSAHPGGALGSELGGCVLRAPQGGGPFLISRRPVPEVIDSLRSSSRMGSYGAAGLLSLGCSLLAYAALRRGRAPTGPGGGSGSGTGAGAGGMAESAALLATGVRERVLGVFGRGQQTQLHAEKSRDRGARDG